MNPFYPFGFLILLLSCCLCVEGFVCVHSPSTSTRKSVMLEMAGFGTKAQKNKKKKTKSTSFDVSASLSRLEKRYDEVMLQMSKQMAKNDEDPRWASSVDDGEEFITSEYVITARAEKKKGVHDWVPIAQLCISYPESMYDSESKEFAEAAVSSYCREISYVAGMGAPVFQSIARNDVEYATEPVESFYKYVYESVVEENKDRENMSKAEAREILGLEDEPSADKNQIKQAYRKLSFQLHPDRVDESSDAAESASRFEKVQLAYETLSSGIRENGENEQSSEVILFSLPFFTERCYFLKL